MAYKVTTLGFDLTDVLPRTRYRVTLEMTLDGHDDDTRVRTFLPRGDAHQEITGEANAGALFAFTTTTEGENRLATWTRSNTPNHARIEVSYNVLTSPLRYDIDPTLAVPTEYPPSIAPLLRPEEAVQVDAPEIAATLTRIGADRGPVLERLRRIYTFTSALRQRPFKGVTDALTALRLREASCNGKSRLFAALARAAGIPTRLVGGLVLEQGTKRTSHQWVEVYVAGYWVPICPTNRRFAELPPHYLVLYRGDHALFRHTAEINFNYAFTTTSVLVPSPAAKRWLAPINVWALFERLGLSFALLQTLLMLPIGAFVVVLFRNVVGLPTFGTFLPALIAAAAAETGAGWGVVGVFVVVVVVAVVRWSFAKLELLHSPSLAILLTAVAVTLLATSLAAERAGLIDLAHIVVFPVAVMAITAERFYLTLAEKTPQVALKELGGTLVVMLGCYAVMSSLALQALVIGFPEVLLFFVAANIYLGRWVGMRVVEYRRFRMSLRAEAGSPG